jgi:hypothetical protein
MNTIPLDIINLLVDLLKPHQLYFLRQVCKNICVCVKQHPKFNLICVNKIAAQLLKNGELNLLQEANHLPQNITKAALKVGDLEFIKTLVFEPEMSMLIKCIKREQIEIFKYLYGKMYIDLFDYSNLLETTIPRQQKDIHTWLCQFKDTYGADNDNNRYYRMTYMDTIISIHYEFPEKVINKKIAYIDFFNNFDDNETMAIPYYVYKYAFRCESLEVIQKYYKIIEKIGSLALFYKYIVKENRIDVLDWCIRNHMPGMFYIYDHATKFGKLEFITKFSVISHTQICEIAVKKGHIHILEWLHINNHKFSEEDINICHNIGVHKWFISKGLIKN